VRQPRLLNPLPSPKRRVPPLIGPSPRTHGTIHYNPILERVILTSGTSCANTWEEIVTETNPGKRTMYSMAYDENSDKVILFSGEQTSKYANDLTTAVWMFDPATLE
jgi:hypothetical protein